MTASLFIGGCADGQWIDARGSQFFRCSFDLFPMPDNPYSEANIAEATKQIHVYRMDVYRVGDNEWTVYVLTSIGAAQAFETLLRGYRRPGRKS